MTPARHSFVWIVPDARDKVATVNPEDAATLADWLAHDRPLIVRRPEACVAVAANHAPLGLALPPPQGKRRIGVLAPWCAIARVAAPSRLSDIVDTLPQDWRQALLHLDRAACALDIELRVFGSAAWQALTGVSYVMPQSDIDLLWPAQSRAQLAAGIALLEAWERGSGLRADGEILFAGDRAVAWREWQAGDATLLVKSRTQVELCERARLLAEIQSEVLCV